VNPHLYRKGSSTVPSEEDKRMIPWMLVFAFICLREKETENRRVWGRITRMGWELLWKRVDERYAKEYKEQRIIMRGSGVVIGRGDQVSSSLYRLKTNE